MRRSVAGRRLGLALAALGALAAASSPALPQEAPAAEEPRLLEVPEPNLDAMEPAVRDQLAGARAVLEAALEASDAPPGERAELYGRLGQLYLLYELFDAAEAALANAQALAPGDRRWPYYRGGAAQETGRLDDAAGHFERALELRPDDLPALLRLGQVELDRNRPDEAQRHFERALALDPGSAAAGHGLGQVAFLRERHREAAERFEAVLAAQPEATVVHYQLALAYRELGELDRARSHLERRGTERVRFDDPLIQRLGALATGAGTFLVQGNRAFAEGDFELAAEAYRRAVEASPADLTARRAHAAALARSGRTEEAEAEFRRVLEVEADDAVTRYNLATLLAQQGEVREALEQLGRAVALDPGFVDAHFNLATTYEGLGRYGEAVRHYDRVLELDPQDTAARVRRAGILDRAGDAAGAEAELSALAASRPDSPEIALALAKVLGRQGRFREAAGQFGRAAELVPESEEAHFGAATALLLGGYEAEAAARLEASLEALPESLPLLHALARLRAASRDPAVRDGERALALAQRVMTARPSLDHAETVAMALAETGRAAEAAALQRDVVARARAAGHPDLAAIEARLAAYERGEPVRAPWKDES